MSVSQKPFKDREDLKKEIARWFGISLFCQLVGFLLALVGIIADASDRTLGLETNSWFLLAIFFSMTAAAPLLKSAAAKSLYGIESESKNK
jgi:hypothetical protein